MTKIGITGHQNIPSIAIPFIKKEIRRILDLHQGQLQGITSLAAGADQLFAEVILSIGGVLHSIIPCKNYETTFVTLTDLEQYLKLKNKSKIIETLDYDEPSGEAFLNAGKKIANTCDVLLAIWDGKKPRGKGGTADIVEHAYHNGKTVEILWPTGINRNKSNHE